MGLNVEVAVVTLLMLAALSFTGFTEEERGLLAKLDIGKTLILKRPDGCNTCQVSYRKVGRTTVIPTSVLSCTTKYCPMEMPVIEFEHPLIEESHGN